MPDPTTPVAPPPVAPPTSAPVVPASDPPAPAAPAAPAEVGQLSADHQIQMQGKDGQQVSVRLGDMAEAYRNQPDAEVLANVDLYKRAIGGDNAALAEFTNKFAPAPETTPEDKLASALQQIEVLTKQQTDMQQSMTQNINPLMNRIQAQADVMHCQKLIDGNSDNFPLCKKDPQSAQMVERRMRDYVTAARSHNPNFNLGSVSPDILKSFQDGVLREQEDFMRNRLSGMGIDPDVFVKQLSAQSGKPPITSVDDQGDNANKDFVPPRFVRDDRTGLLMDPSSPQMQVPTPEQMMPAQPVAPAVGGSPTSVVPDPGPPKTMDQLRGAMRARTDVLGGGA